VALQLREPAEGEVNPPPPAGWPQGFAETMGWLPAGPVLLRLDVAERIAAELGYLTRRAPAPPPQDLASRLGVKADTLGVTLAALGFRLLEAPPLEEGQYGPPTPLRVAQPRPQHHHQPRGADRRPGRPNQAAGPQQRDHAQRDHAQRDRRPPQHQRRPEAAPVLPEGHYGPPVPPELRQPREARPDRGPRPQGRPYQGKGPAQGPRHDGPRHEGARQQGGDQRQDQRRDQPRGPRPPQEATRGSGREESRQRPPYQGPIRERQEPRKPPEPRINPDSPFAILATLKLR
jgi:ATP-dependent RNA helicase SUPV3L1/SUV3